MPTAEINQNAVILFFCWITIAACTVLILKLKFGLTGKSTKFYLAASFILLVPMPLSIISEINDSNFLRIISALTAFPAIICAHYIAKYLHLKK